VNADAIREVLALYTQGNPADAISFGATGVLPVSRVPVQVVAVGMYGEAS
jgi:hypothetical protein